MVPWLLFTASIQSYFLLKASGRAVKGSRGSGKGSVAVVEDWPIEPNVQGSYPTKSLTFLFLRLLDSKIRQY